MGNLLNMQVKVRAVWALVMILSALNFVVDVLVRDVSVERWLDRTVSYVVLAISLSVLAFIRKRDERPKS